MTRYVAFLRAINVGGHVVKMDELRRLFERAGLTDVETFIASGNVVFSSSARKPAELEHTLEAQLHAALGYEVVTFLRTVPEVVAVAQHQPFPDAEFSAGAELYISFLRGKPNAETERKMLVLNNRIDQFHIHQRELYWLRRRQLGESAYSGAFIERTLKAAATARNATTVRKIAAKVQTKDKPKR
jgi:uncharacterized protein (DUF1697 family)